MLLKKSAVPYLAALAHVRQVDSSGSIDWEELVAASKAYLAAEAASDMCTAAHARLREGSGSIPRVDSAPRALASGPVSMGSLVSADERAVASAVRNELGPVSVNINATIGVVVDPDVKEGETEEETAAIVERLTQRADDTEEALKQRLVNFAANRDAVAATFESVALSVDGNRDPDTVWGEIDAFLSK